MSINKLNKIQTGRYAENLTKIEFMRLGLEVCPIYSMCVDLSIQGNKLYLQMSHRNRAVPSLL